MQSSMQLSGSNHIDHVDQGSDNSGNARTSNISACRAVIAQSGPAHLNLSSGPLPSPPPVRHQITRVNHGFICRNCLSEGHLATSCSSKIRCRVCYGYGHIARSCFNRRRKSLVYRKKNSATGSILAGSQGGVIISPNLLQNEGSVEHSGDALPPLPPASPMVNYPYDIIPHLPPGMGFIPPNGLRPQVATSPWGVPSRSHATPGRSSSSNQSCTLISLKVLQYLSQISWSGRGD